ncbi:hypothetical protein M378DRAFT_94973 [Amanita muscaria Koide BX008]|uniref:Proteasome maturation factor UMP1 n=1 Tax=Amanita muscaria (strain Koide BX008) TaxID=946122 RepID=A0A0C2XN73_AMAMK|nr:hypothetical protein M378DRAFT_94973 [Amanita muscaria Koide BX008]
MQSSYRIVPAHEQKSASTRDTANDLGLHDTLHYGPVSLASNVKTQCAVRDRLENWDLAQDSLRLSMKRDIHGMHAPLRLLMERKLVSADHHMPALPRSNLQLDILMGRDDVLEPADVFGGMETALPLDIHKDMEKKVRL